jgi:hypothetical protein
MLKNITQFKSVINGIETLFHFEQNTPIATAKEAILECLKWLGQVEDQAKAMQEAQAKVELEKSESISEKSDKIEQMQA